MTVPSMWRIELLHPLVVHFPLALLVTGAGLWLLARAVGARGRWAFAGPAARLLLGLGVPLAWLAVWSGTLADAEVARSLCDPTVKRLHEELAWATAFVFTGALALDLATLRSSLGSGLRTALRVGTAAALVAGVSLLVYVGHLGSRLVYEQAAAVYRPSATCAEFE